MNDRSLLLAVAGMAGFEPANIGVKVLCLTSWRHPKMYLFAFCSSIITRFLIKSIPFSIKFFFFLFLFTEKGRGAYPLS